MRAAVLERVGEPLKIYDDVDIMQPRAGEIRVAVRYCGLCNSDYAIVSGKFPVEEPIIIGHEASGIVESVGEGVTHLKPGDPVVLTPLPPCGICYYCQRGDHSLCVNGMSLATMALPDGETGLTHRGRRILRGVGVAALAELVVTPATGAVKIPEDLPLETACVIGCAVQTGAGAVINTAGVEEGATVLIMGLGGIGLSAVQGAAIAGASTIIASDPLASRRDMATQFGATQVLDPTADDIAATVMASTGGIGMDYVFETAGVAALIEQGVGLTRSGGTTVCVGAPPLEDSVTLENVVMFGTMEKKLCGCLLGSSNALRDIPRLVRLWQSGRLDLESMITSRRPLEQINEGFADLQAGRGVRTVIEI